MLPHGDHPGYCTAEFGNTAGPYELPCTFLPKILTQYNYYLLSYYNYHTQLAIRAAGNQQVLAFYGFWRIFIENNNSFHMRLN
jgi:hypothetical protein